MDQVKKAVDFSDLELRVFAQLEATITKLRLEHAYASMALERAASRGGQLEFDVALAYKLDVTDRLCKALAVYR